MDLLNSTCTVLYNDGDVDIDHPFSRVWIRREKFSYTASEKCDLNYSSDEEEEEIDIVGGGAHVKVVDGIVFRSGGIPRLKARQTSSLAREEERIVRQEEAIVEKARRQRYGSIRDRAPTSFLIHEEEGPQWASSSKKQKVVAS